jgi:hypothetical protein
MPVVDEAVLVGKIGRHGRHDDTVLEFEGSDAKGTEERFKGSHCVASRIKYSAGEAFSYLRGCDKRERLLDKHL